VNLSVVFFKSAHARARVWTSSLDSFQASFSSASSDFKDARYLVAEPLSPGSVLSVVSYSMKIARQKGGGEFKVSPEHRSGIIGF
jgi:hypothetical protein